MCVYVRVLRVHVRVCVCVRVRVTTTKPCENRCYVKSYKHT